MTPFDLNLGDEWVLNGMTTELRIGIRRANGDLDSMEPPMFWKHKRGEITAPRPPTVDGPGTNDFLQAVLDHAWFCGMRPQSYDIGATSQEVMDVMWKSGRRPTDYEKNLQYDGELDRQKIMDKLWNEGERPSFHAKLNIPLDMNSFVHNDNVQPMLDAMWEAGHRPTGFDESATVKVDDEMAQDTNPGRSYGNGEKIDTLQDVINAQQSHIEDLEVVLQHMIEEARHARAMADGGREVGEMLSGLRKRRIEDD